MVRLIIDDLRILNLTGDVKYARTVNKALDILNEAQELDDLWLDHDLGYSDGHFQDIWPVVAYIEERLTYNPIKIGEVYVITSNPVGAQRLKLAFDRMGYQTTVFDPKPVLAGVLPW